MKWIDIKSILRIIWEICCLFGGSITFILLPILIICAATELFGDKEEEEEKPNYSVQMRYIGDKYIAHIDLNGPCYFYDKETGETVLEDAALVCRDANIYDSLTVYRVCNDETRNEKEKGLRGYFNTNTGKVQIEPQYQHAWFFNGGMAAVCQNDSVFFIDTQGNPANDKKFPYEEFYDYMYDGGYCKIKMGNKYGLIDRQGEWVLTPTYDTIESDPYGGY